MQMPPVRENQREIDRQPKMFEPIKPFVVGGKIPQNGGGKIFNQLFFSEKRGSP